MIKQVENGETVTPPSGYENRTWYLLGDEEKKEIDFEHYPIKEETSFVLHKVHTVRWMEEDEDVDEYCDPIMENTTGITTLDIKLYGITTIGFVYMNYNMGDTETIYFNGCGSMFGKLLKNNTGGINVEGGHDCASLIDDYGLLLIRDSGFNRWPGGYSGNDFARTVNVSPINAPNNIKKFQLSGYVDEDNHMLFYGDIVNKAIRVPYKGFDGKISIKQFPYNFVSSLFFEDPKITYVTILEDNNTIEQTNVVNNTLNSDGISFYIEQGNSVLDYDLSYTINENNTCNYKNHIIYISTQQLNQISNYDEYGIMLHFIQEYNVKNRIYYGYQHFLQVKDFDDRYHETQSQEYEFHAWFEVCSSKVLTGENPITINVEYMVAYPNSEDFEYIADFGEYYEILKNNYMWGDKSYTIVRIYDNELIFNKK